MFSNLVSSSPRLSYLLGCRSCDLVFRVPTLIFSPSYSPCRRRVRSAQVLSAALSAPGLSQFLFGGEHTDTFNRYQCCELPTLSVWSHTPACADIPLA